MEFTKPENGMAGTTKALTIKQLQTAVGDNLGLAGQVQEFLSQWLLG